MMTVPVSAPIWTPPPPHLCPCSNATVSTRPTAAGEDVLDPFHPYGLTKHLMDKQVGTGLLHQ